jgi:hypothetical protein
LKRLAFSELTLEDEESFTHVGLYADLVAIARKDDLRFAIAGDAERPGAQRALLLNLLFWEPRTADVLPSEVLPADVAMHVVWHHLAAKHLPPGGLSDLLAESIASAFDVYLVGRLLGHRPNSEFLASQVPRMADAALDAGLSERAFEELLESTARDPEAAFEAMRALLFEAACALTEPGSLDDAELRLTPYETRPFGALLHHFEVPTWVLRTLLAQAREDTKPRDRDALALHAELKSATRSLDWLEQHWVRGNAP